MLHKMDKDLPTIIYHVKGVRIVLERDCLASIHGIPDNGNIVTNDDYESSCNKLRDRSADGFLPIKKITRSGIGVSSLHPVEGDDEVEASNDMDENTFEQLQINQEIQGMLLTEIVESTRRYANELAHQRASIDCQEVMLAHLKRVLLGIFLVSGDFGY
ncbi:hypothetical protein M9H77_23417 [Catharanthus roseus]|uniref:Uncharacterized protein n=1 Tax=Catharanthus roseus TaxID=4058 RepID=A0ACC0AVF6_CATRO|nr:hypothetical protein M9H77_23417 [Catharanthus roseus]